MVFCDAVYFDGRLCDGPGAVMNERERMDDVGFYEIVFRLVGMDLQVGGANGIGEADIWVVVVCGW